MTKKMTPAEIERRLLADANNPDAWEHVATVPASGRSAKVVKATPATRKK